MKKIPLTQGQVALVDDCDFERVVALGSWYYNQGYAVHGERRRGKYHTTLMHRLILGDPQGDTDHANGNGLDNRRCNLRACSRSQNAKNQRPRNRPDKTSHFKGVGWYKPYGKWRAKIMVDYRTIHLGYFASEEDAARAYDEAARKYHGQFARLNGIA
jgi:hypothetical protein